MQTGSFLISKEAGNERWQIRAPVRLLGELLFWKPSAHFGRQKTHSSEEFERYHLVNRASRPRWRQTFRFLQSSHRLSRACFDSRITELNLTFALAVLVHVVNTAVLEEFEVMFFTLTSFCSRLSLKEWCRKIKTIELLMLVNGVFATCYRAACGKAVVLNL